MYWSTGDAPRLSDPRSKTLHAYLDVVDTVLPRVLLLENVKGLTYSGKDEGLRFLERGLGRINTKHSTAYLPQVYSFNAADYGVPQLRERVFIIACIDGRRLEMPRSTHGRGPNRRPWLTAWDAIGDLDTGIWPEELEPTGRWAALLPSIPEGHNYLWHTPRNSENGGEPLFGWRTRFWSFLLKLAKTHPSWTIQAAPGPATGPFHWKNRLLSAEELCRLQTLPPGYNVVGDRRSVQRQIGNAVPSALGELLGLEIRRQLLGEHVRRTLRLLPDRRSDCPPPERTASVPRRYLGLRANHGEHPGTGLGPAARKRYGVDP
jgi:DNA (cytosine-5)-methyltransferase 1